jgi:hypothetical protein
MTVPQPVRRHTRLRLVSRFILLLAAICGFTWIIGFPRRWDDEELPPTTNNAKAANSPAPYHVENDQLVVSIRTTAADAFAKIPPLLLLTNPRYHGTLLLMGDLPMDIGAFHVHDVLDRLDGHVLASNPELERYRQQLNYARLGIDPRTAKSTDAQEERRTLARLDKYKMLRMLERAWQFKPDRSWYVFVDTETYLVRANLMAWLGQHDPSEATFFANPPDPNSDEPFATSGNTFILSGHAMHQLFVDRNTGIKVWDTRATDYKSSFDVLYTALSTELNLKINTTWPTISGFHPSTVPYGPGFWCEQVMSMHSVSVEVASDMWRFERDRTEHEHVRDPLLFADLWIRFLQPENFTTPRDDWDNLSDGLENAKWNILFEGVESDARKTYQKNEAGRAANGEASWEACKASCDGNESCVQWSYASVATPNYNENGATKCHVSRSMRLGRHVEPEETVVGGKGGKGGIKGWKSGWKKEKFEKWARQQRCKGQQN